MNELNSRNLPAKFNIFSLEPNIFFYALIIQAVKTECIGKCVEIISKTKLEFCFQNQIALKIKSKVRFLILSLNFCLEPLCRQEE